MLSNSYFLAKFRFDTAENEPAKNLQSLAKFGETLANAQAAALVAKGHWLAARLLAGAADGAAPRAPRCELMELAEGYESGRRVLAKVRYRRRKV